MQSRDDFWGGRFLMKTRDDSFLAGTIMGDADYYQKIPPCFLADLH